MTGITVTPINRRILFNGTPLTDLNPNIPVSDVVRLHAATNAALTTAQVEGPVTKEDGVQEYTVHARVATKG